MEIKSFIHLYNKDPKFKKFLHGCISNTITYNAELYTDTYFCCSGCTIKLLVHFSNIHKKNTMSSLISFLCIILPLSPSEFHKEAYKEASPSMDGMTYVFLFEHFGHIFEHFWHKLNFGYTMLLFATRVDERVIAYARNGINLIDMKYINGVLVFMDETKSECEHRLFAALVVDVIKEKLEMISEGNSKKLLNYCFRNSSIEPAMELHGLISKRLNLLKSKSNKNK